MITLTKDKIVYSNNMNPKCDEYVKKEVEYLHPYLNEVVKLSEDFTLEDLFILLERDRDIFDMIFSSHLGHYPLQLYTEEIKKPRPEKDGEDELDYLELKRFGERWERGDIDLFIGFSGVGREHDLGISYAIEFTPLNELKHLPLRLNEDFSMSEIIIPPRIVMYPARWLKKIGIPVGKWDNPYSRVYLEGKIEFSVYELISEVLYEISFAGEPAERDAKISKIERDVEDAMKKYGELDGEEE